MQQRKRLNQYSTLTNAVAVAEAADVVGCGGDGGCGNCGDDEEDGDSFDDKDEASKGKTKHKGCCHNKKK